MVDTTQALRDVRPRLERAFGNRLRGVILYGSRARGDHRPDSDADVLVVLSGPVALERDVPTAVDALYALQLELDYPIHASPVDERAFLAQEHEIYRRARREGIPL